MSVIEEHQVPEVDTFNILQAPDIADMQRLHSPERVQRNDNSISSISPPISTAIQSRIMLLPEQNAMHIGTLSGSGCNMSNAYVDAVARRQPRGNGSNYATYLFYRESSSCQHKP